MIARTLLGTFVFLFLLTFLNTGTVHGQSMDTLDCNSNMFPCMDPQGVSRCIPNSWICDGFSDCYDNMDEANCFYQETNCTANTNGEIVQCGASRCLSSSSPLLCNGVVDCRGYNGTYVYAEYGVDESPDYCIPATTSTTTIFPSSRGWQPAKYTNFPNQAFTYPPLANLTAPPFTQITTTDAFWRSYCSRQVAINYCPRRCALHGLCAPLRINPPRWELSKMIDEMNPPVVGPLARTRVPPTQAATTQAAGSTTTPSLRQRLLSDELLQRILLDENRLAAPIVATQPPPPPPQPTPAPSRYNGNSLDSNNKKRRDSSVDPGLMADTNMIYDWSDDEHSSAISSMASSAMFIFVTILFTINNLF